MIDVIWMKTNRKDHKGTIDHWFVVASRARDSTFQLVGDLRGCDVCTTAVLRIEGGIAETENSIYTLGEPALCLGQF